MLSLEKQQYHLQRVSRTFALTIPLMHGTPADCVANAYLICRIADSMEDNPVVDPSLKSAWLSRFASCLDQGFDPAEAAALEAEAASLLKEGAVAEEYELCCEMQEVLARTRSYPAEVQHIIGHGAALLCRGMAEHLALALQVAALPDVDRYCYAVAGVVGEMLALLFAFFDPRADKKALLELSVSFGEGLQLTNILKDRAVDDDRQASFLPACENGLKGAELIAYYCAVTQGHLKQAGDFICKLPRSSGGARLFCLLNTAMAVLTVKKIENNPLGAQSELKISRSAVKKALFFCVLCSRSNLLVTAYLKFLRSGSKMIERDAAVLRAAVSAWPEA